MKYYYCFYCSGKLTCYSTSHIYKTTILKKNQRFFRVSRNNKKDICLAKLAVDMKINTQNKGMSFLEKHKRYR